MIQKGWNFLLKNILKAVTMQSIAAARVLFLHGVERLNN